MGGKSKPQRTSITLAIFLILAACGPNDQGPPGATPATTADAPRSTATQVTCGMQVADDLTLSADMHCDSTALTVVGNGVTIDLNGFTLSGPGAGRRSWPLPNFDVVGLMVQADHVTIRNGTVQEFGMAVLLNDQRGVIVENVTASGNYYGLYVYKGSGNQIRNNRIVANVYGLHLQESAGNDVRGNELSRQTHHSPGGYGLYLYTSRDNWFEGNTIENNLNWGLWFSNSTGNTIVRNNIIGNDPQVSDDSGGNRFYDEQRREGNYWDDYRGTDDNGDGIGEVPYSIGGPGRAADIYPFIAANGWNSRTSQTLAPATPPPPPRSAPRAFVALADGRVALLDLGSRSVLTTWQAGTRGQLAVSPDGATLYAIVGEGDDCAVVAFDAATGWQRRQWPAPHAQALAATYDGTRVLISTDTVLLEIVLETGEIRSQQDGRDAVAITPSWKHNLVIVTGEDGWLSIVYLPDQHSPYGTRLPAAPLQAIDNRAGTRLFVVMHARPAVSVIDTEQFIETDTVPLGDADVRFIRIGPSPDGASLYVLDTANSRVWRVDLGSKRTLAELTLDGGAVDLAVSADGALVTVVVAGSTAGRAVILDSDLRPLASIALPQQPVRVVAPR
ncbi:MAG: hypothetical protein DCC58_15695 [Chloroflexi bacterium]|nr:MAG: hypothetical protein DCC58_15695 [Chloroflexota bacterium]